MRTMEIVCPRPKYDSWREVERMLRRTRDRGMRVTLPAVSIQAVAPPQEEESDAR